MDVDDKGKGEAQGNEEEVDYSLEEDDEDLLMLDEVSSNPNGNYM